MRKIVFLSGLPRSGSTLLSAILRQNPKVSAGMSSPMFSLVNAMINKLSNANEFSVFFDDAARARILRGLFTSYYADPAREVVFDTNRQWTSRLPVLLALFPDARFVCCVRPIGEILQSFETLFQKNPLQVSRMFNFNPDLTVYDRFDHLMSSMGVVGYAVNSLKEAFYGPLSERLMIVSYNRLARDTAQTLALIYDFVGEPGFAHDLNNVAYAEPTFDNALGLPGLHNVRARVGVADQIVSLPPDLRARVDGVPFWAGDQAFSRARVII